MALSGIDAVCVTYGPGLAGPLIVGVGTAKAIAYAASKPLVGVHHIEGHIAANYIEHSSLEPPFLCLVVSGGHTHLVQVSGYNKFDIIGHTHDDAAGEAFDKVARALGLGYPGGPEIDRVAKNGNPAAINFPRAKVDGCEFDFSFSGLKSAVLNYLNSCDMKNVEVNVADVAASFQQAVADVLVSRSVNAAKQYGSHKIAVAGGVAANSFLRAAMQDSCKINEIELYYPSPVYCTDNAVMIAVQGYYNFMAGIRSGLDLNAVPNLKLGCV